MINSKKSILFRKKGAIALSKGTVRTKLSQKDVIDIITKLQAYGYRLEDNVIVDMLQGEYDKDKTLDNFECVFDMLNNLISNKHEYKTLYSNFTDKDVNKDAMEMYIKQLLHYVLGYKEIENYDKESYLLQSKEYEKLKVLKVTTFKAYNSLLKEMLTQTVAMSDSDKEDLIVLLKATSSEDLDKVLSEVDIKLKETLVLLVDFLIVNRKDVDVGALFDLPRDVLRYLAYKEGYDRVVSSMRFPKYSKEELNLIYSLLEGVSTKNNLDDYKLTQFRHIWAAFFSYNRFAKTKYPNLFIAKEVVFGRHKHTTREAILENLYSDFLKNKDKISFDKLIYSKELTKRPGIFIRRINSILLLSASIDKNMFNEALQTFFISISGQITSIDTKTLVQFRNYVLNIDKTINEEIPRMVMIKNAIVPIENYNFSEKEISNINKNYDAKRVLRVIDNLLVNSYMLEDSLPSIYLDEAYKKIAVPTSERDSSKSLHTLPSGSRIKVDNKGQTIRFFASWKDNTEKRISPDIDLSLMLFYEGKGKVDSVNWQNYDLCLSEGEAYHNIIHFSGDCIRAKDGASEYFDIDIDKLKEIGVTHVALHVTSYAGFSFKELNENNIDARAGFMLLDEDLKQKDDKFFYEANVEESIYLNTGVGSSILSIMDLNSMEYIWVDRGVSYSRINSTIHGDADVIGGLINYYNKGSVTSVYDILRLNLIARGNLIDNITDSEKKELLSYKEALKNDDVDNDKCYILEKERILDVNTLLTSWL